MATLKSIKNKYLSASDGETLGVTTNTENVSLLSFKLATADSLSKFNLVDGFSDDYQDATGVDAATSSDVRRMTGNYYKGAVSGNATGGTIASYSSGGTTYKVHTLANGNNFVTPAAGTVDFLIVAGGGGGWYGGGGAGGVVYGSDQTLSAGTYAAVVGAGGAQRNVGNDSTFNSFTSKGGGAAGNYGATGGTGGSGGGGGQGNPGGGAGGGTNQDTYSGTTNVTGYGTDNSAYKGGGYSPPNDDGSQGGAGAGGTVAWVPVGAPAGSYNWPNFAQGGGGGVGRQFDITGTNTYYGGGGGASYGGDVTGGGAGGSGGGGAGGVTSGANGSPGTDGLGGGGGGGHSGTGGAGGAGTVIVRYIENDFVTSAQANGTLISNAYTAQAVPTTARVIIDEYSSIGSSTLNTDIKAYASRDNGSTYTQITLANQGTIETNHRLLSGSVDISGQPSGTSVKYKIETLNQSGSKETRVYGTSMAWA